MIIDSVEFKFSESEAVTSFLATASRNGGFKGSVYTCVMELENGQNVYAVVAGETRPDQIDGGAGKIKGGWALQRGAAITFDPSLAGIV